MGAGGEWSSLSTDEGDWERINNEKDKELKGTLNPEVQPLSLATFITCNLYHLLMHPRPRCKQACDTHMHTVSKKVMHTCTQLPKYNYNTV